MADVTEFTDSNFQSEVVLSSEPVLVDFWAPWCPPCRMIAPVVEELAVENKGSFKIGKVNIDDNPTLAANFSVGSIPTLLVFKKGEVVASFVGVQSKATLQRAIDQAKS